MPSLHLFVDPLNPHGWGAEPRLRRLRLAFPDVEWSLRPLGVVESWNHYDGPEIPSKSRMAAVCSRVSEERGMPIDEYLWFEDPPSGSVPASRAIAAARPGETSAWRVLRTLREATFLRRENVARAKTLRTELESVPGLDAEGIVRAVTGDEDLLGRHRDLYRDLEEAGADDERPRLPSLVVGDLTDDRGGSTGTVDLTADFEENRRAIAAGVDSSGADGRVDVESALDRFSPEGWLCARELAAVTGRSPADAAEMASELDDTAERTFAAEPFWRDASHVTGVGDD